MRDIIATYTTSHTPPDGIPITEYSMNYSDCDSLPKPDSESKGYNGIYPPSYLTPEGYYLPPEGETSTHCCGQGLEKLIYS